MISEEHNRKSHNIVLYFQVHQPRRLHSNHVTDDPNQRGSFDDQLNASILRRIARDCYLPANNLLLQLIGRHPEIKITFSLSGIVIEQMQNYAPEVLESFQNLSATGSVEFLGETYYHSLASLIHSDEFEIQVLQHAEKIMEIFGVRPTVFRNTELIYSNDIGHRVAMMGYAGIFAEGYGNIPGIVSPHQLYRHPGHEHLKLFLRNYRLSDDIANRFIQGGEKLSAERYLSWLYAMPPEDKLINVAMDYETFGEHQKSHTGIFSFLEELLGSLAKNDRLGMILPSEALKQFPDSPPLSVDRPISWGDPQRYISDWLGDDRQKEAFKSIMKLEGEVRSLGEEKLLKDWRYLQTSDHFFYMSPKRDGIASGHSCFSPFSSSNEAFGNYQRAVEDLTFRIQAERCNSRRDGHDLSSWEAERQELKTSTPVWVMKLESVPQGNIPDVHN